jgi:hypothetical protein
VEKNAGKDTILVIREKSHCILLPLDSRNQDFVQIPGFWNSGKKVLRFFSAHLFNFRNLHYCRAAFSSQLKSKVGNILTKAAALRIMLNIDGAPIDSKSHTHPSHSTTFRLLTSSLFLSVQVPHATQCMRGV